MKCHSYSVRSVCLTIMALSAFSTFADVSVVGGERFTYDGTDPSIDGSTLSVSGTIPTVFDVKDDLSLQLGSVTGGGILKIGSGDLTLNLPETLSSNPWNLQFSKRSGYHGYTNYGVTGNVVFVESGGVDMWSGFNTGFNLFEGGLELVGNGTNQTIKTDCLFVMAGNLTNENSRSVSLTLKDISWEYKHYGEAFYLWGNTFFDESSYVTNTVLSLTNAVLTVHGFGNASGNGGGGRATLCDGKLSTSSYPRLATIAVTNAQINASSVIAFYNGYPTHVFIGTNGVISGGTTTNPYFTQGIIMSGTCRIWIEDGGLMEQNGENSWLNWYTEGSGKICLSRGGRLRVNSMTFSSSSWAGAQQLYADGGVIEFKTSGVSFGAYKNNTFYARVYLQGDGLILSADEGVDHVYSFKFEPLDQYAPLVKRGPGRIRMDQIVTNIIRSSSVYVSHTSIAGLLANHRGGTRVEEGTLVFSNGTFRAGMDFKVDAGATLAINSSSEAGTQKLGALTLAGGTLDCSGGEPATFEVSGFSVPASATASTSGLTVRNAAFTLPDGQAKWTLDFNRDNSVVYRSAKLPILTLDSGAAFDLTQLSPVNCGNQMTCVLTREGDTIYATISRKGFCISFR